MVEPDKAELVVLACALKHGLSEGEVRAAWRRPVAMRYRGFDAPAVVAAAGPGPGGGLVEMLGAEQEDGTVVVYHAMALTAKMARELGL